MALIDRKEKGRELLEEAWCSQLLTPASAARCIVDSLHAWTRSEQTEIQTNVDSGIRIRPPWTPLAVPDISRRYQ